MIPAPAVYIRIPAPAVYIRIFQGWALHAGPHPHMDPPSPKVHNDPCSCCLHRIPAPADYILDPPKALSRLHGFSAAAKQISGRDGNFILLDMDTVNEQNRGQWRRDGGSKGGSGWHGRWGMPFIWTALHTFGGCTYTHGNLTEVNMIPFDAPPLTAYSDPGADPKTQAIGVGYTPEGLDQNPTYFELLQVDL